MKILNYHKNLELLILYPLEKILKKNKEMKKLIEKDKKIRRNIKSVEKKHFILKFIFNNFNFFILIR